MIHLDQRKNGKNLLQLPWHFVIVRWHPMGPPATGTRGLPLPHRLLGATPAFSVASGVPSSSALETKMQTSQLTATCEKHSNSHVRRKQQTMKEQVYARAFKGGIWNAIMTVKEWQHEMRDLFSDSNLGETIWLSTLIYQASRAFRTGYEGKRYANPPSYHSEMSWGYWMMLISTWCFKWRCWLSERLLRGAVGFHPEVKLPPPLRVSGVHDTWLEVVDLNVRWARENSPKTNDISQGFEESSGHTTPITPKALVVLNLKNMTPMTITAGVFVSFLVLVCEMCCQMLSGAEELLISRLMEGKSTNWDRAKRCAEQLRSPDYTTQHFHETRPKRISWICPKNLKKRDIADIALENVKTDFGRCLSVGKAFLACAITLVLWEWNSVTMTNAVTTEIRVPVKGMRYLWFAKNYSCRYGP